MVLVGAATGPQKEGRVQTAWSRRREEFYCGECRSYFDTYLRSNMTGSYTVECPNEKCRHHHHRIIRSGLVTGDRCNDKAPMLDIIMGLPTTLRDSPKAAEVRPLLRSLRKPK